MTFSDYYELKNQGLLPEQILEETHSDMLRTIHSGTSAAECKKLENFLNQLFYPKKYKSDSNKYHDKIINLIETAYQEQYDKVLENFELGGKNDIKYSSSNINSINNVAREKYETFKHTDRIYFDTLEKRRNNLKKELENIDVDKLEIKDIQNYQKELNKCIADIEKLLAHRTGSSHKFLSLKDDENLLEQVNKIDAAYQALSSESGVLSPQDYGQILEWILQAVSSNEEGSIIDNISEEIGYNELQKIFNTAGSEKTSYLKNNFINGKIESLKNTSLTTEIKNDKKIQKMTIGSGKNKLTFEYQPSFNPNSSRQGKVDVNFYLPDENKLIPFKISAKNWKSLTKRDFGDTNIAYALIRSLGDDNTFKYLYLMQDGKDIVGNTLKNVHAIAKYAIILDILMGLSQKENYADTVVINVREEQRFIVFSILETLEEIYKGLTRIKINGYDDHAIRSNLIVIRKSALGAAVQKSKAFTDYSIKYLQSLRVYLEYKTIKPFIK